MDNSLLPADAYKYSHHKLYYPGATKIYSYLESRSREKAALHIKTRAVLK